MKMGLFENKHDYLNRKFEETKKVFEDAKRKWKQSEAALNNSVMKEHIKRDQTTGKVTSYMAARGSIAEMEEKKKREIAQELGLKLQKIAEETHKME